MTTQPHPRDLSLVLSFVDFRRWSTKGRVLNIIRAETVDARLPTPVELPWRELAAFLGRSRRTAGETLGALVEDRVLAYLEPSGTRPGGYAISGAFERWRNVPWILEHSEVLMRVAGASFMAEVRAQELASGRGHARALAPLARGGMSARSERLVTGHSPARKAGLSGRAWPRAQGVGIPSFEEKTLRIDDDEGLLRLKAAIREATGGGEVWGRKERELREIAARANGSLEALVDLARRSGAKSPVAVVDLLAQADLADVAHRAKRKDPERVRLERWLAALEASGSPEEEILEVKQALANLEA